MATRRTLSHSVLHGIVCVAACMACDAKRAQEVLEDAASMVTDVPCPSDGRPLLEGIVDIEAADDNACALDGEGKVYCWGGPILESERGNPVPWQVQDLPPARELQIDHQFTAITRDDHVYIWGGYVSPFYRRVRAPECTSISAPCREIYEPLDPLLDPHLAAALHPDEVVALDEDEGDPPQRRSTKRAIPTRTARTRGHFISQRFILDPDVGFRCTDREYPWVTDALNRAGAGTPDDPLVHLVLVLDSSREVDNWCRVFRSGAVACDVPSSSEVEETPPPVAFRLPAAIRGVGTGDSQHFLFVLEDGRVATWDEEYEPYIPEKVAMIRSADYESWNACGLRADGSAWCWAQPPSRTRATDLTEPVQVEGIRGAVEIAVGLKFGCALLSDGHVRCWGDNEVGQLGNGSFGEPIKKACPVVAPGEPR